MRFKFTIMPEVFAYENEWEEEQPAQEQLTWMTALSALDH